MNREEFEGLIEAQRLSQNEESNDEIKQRIDSRLALFRIGKYGELFFEKEQLMTCRVAYEANLYERILREGQLRSFVEAHIFFHVLKELNTLVFTKKEAITKEEVLNLLPVKSSVPFTGYINIDVEKAKTGTDVFLSPSETGYSTQKAYLKRSMIDRKKNLYLVNAPFCFTYKNNTYLDEYRISGKL